MRWILFLLIVVGWMLTLVVLVLNPAVSQTLGAAGTSGLVGVLARYLFARENSRTIVRDGIGAELGPQNDRMRLEDGLRKPRGTLLPD
jgi:hypothetical protein